MREVNYIIIEDEIDHVCIKDVGPWNIYLTVTNGAEIVIEELADKLNGRQLFYIDTEGNRDELVYSGKEFIGFKPARP